MPVNAESRSYGSSKFTDGHASNVHRMVDHHPTSIFYHSSRGHRISQDAIDGVRKSLNKYARRIIARLPNASVIAHQLDPSNHSLF